MPKCRWCKKEYKGVSSTPGFCSPSCKSSLDNEKLQKVREKERKAKERAAEKERKAREKERKAKERAAERERKARERAAKKKR